MQKCQKRKMPILKAPIFFLSLWVVEFELFSAHLGLSHEIFWKQNIFENLICVIFFLGKYKFYCNFFPFFC
jgi:hypothetical protein